MTTVERCVSILIGDYKRQSCRLGLDDFNRIVSRLQASREDRLQILRQLAEHDVTINDETCDFGDPADDEIRDPIASDDATTYAFHDLLTHDQEISLARRYQTSVSLGPDLEDQDSFDQHHRIVDAGLEARARLILSNVRLVHDRVKRYANRTTLAKEDLIQEGILGLFRAADKYDPERGFRFATYATWWIDQHIHRVILSKGQVIRVPVHIHQKLQDMKRRQRQLALALGRKPTAAEIAREMGEEIAEIEFLRTVQIEILSLDKQDNSEQLPMSHSAPSRRTIPPDEQAERLELKELIEASIATLPKRSRAILKWRFGLDGKKPRTLEQIGVHLGITRERVRQIEKKSLEKLAQTQRGLKLLDYLPEENETVDV